MHARRISATGWTALWIFAGLLAIYNANGREIGTVDSQPAKFTAREVAVSGTLRLDRVIAERPPLADRPAFAVDTAGHTRSAYPILPGLLAAIPATMLHAAGIVDMDAPVAPNLVAKLTASSLTAGAVVLVFLALVRLVPRAIALATAIGLGLGTNLWAHASQTLWGHETVAFGLALALWAWMRPAAEVRGHRLWVGAVGLILAGSTRPQVAPLVLAMLTWLAMRGGARRALLPAVLVASAAAINMSVNYIWFGHVLGALPRLEAAHDVFHGGVGSIGNPLTGALGLLLSPSRGLLVFSPVVLVAGLGWAAGWKRREEVGLPWLMAGVAVQFLAYASYGVWWGGHTFGPRYMLDLLIPMTPVAALGLSRLVGSRTGVVVASALLAWSVAVAGAGALVYPNDFWNTRPTEVDRNHERLWDIRDSQISRAFGSPLSPQNFNLFSAESVRQAPE